jgi:hypothetical protein
VLAEPDQRRAHFCSPRSIDVLDIALEQPQEHLDARDCVALRAVCAETRVGCVPTIGPERIVHQ